MTKKTPDLSPDLLAKVAAKMEAKMKPPIAITLSESGTFQLPPVVKVAGIHSAGEDHLVLRLETSSVQEIQILFPLDAAKIAGESLVQTVNFVNLQKPPKGRA